MTSSLPPSGTDRLGKGRPEVLIARRQNAGRSIAAGVLLEHYAQGRVVIRSAGSTPADEIHPEIRTVLAERGLATEGLFPKPFTDEMVQAADVVVTMGCGEACPVFPGKRYLDWEVGDPHGQPLEQFGASSTTSTGGSAGCCAISCLTRRCRSHLSPSPPSPSRARRRPLARARRVGPVSPRSPWRCAAGT